MGRMGVPSVCSLLLSCVGTLECRREEWRFECPRRPKSGGADGSIHAEAGRRAHQAARRRTPAHRPGRVRGRRHAYQPAPRDVSPQPVRARADQPNRRGPGAGDGRRSRGADRPANCGTRQTGARHVPNAGISGDRLPSPRRARSIWPRTRTWKRRASVWHTWRIFPPLTPIVRPWKSHRPGSSREPDQGVGAVGDDRYDLPDVVGLAQRVGGAQAFEFFASFGVAHREAAE